MFLEIPLLSFIIWLPIIVGCIFLAIKETTQSAYIIKKISLLTSLISMYLCYELYSGFISKSWNMQFKENIPWVPDVGVYYTLGVDGISMPLIILTCFMTLTVILYSDKVLKDRVIQYNAYFLIMQGMVCGVFAALDAILFYIFFEAMLIPMFLIIGIWGGANRIYATIKFFLYTFFGSIFYSFH